MNAASARIFISYSHRGNGPEWKAWLLRHLGVFEQQHLLDVWQDGKIRVSAYWNDDIMEAMKSARLAVVLLTPEALESEYILKVEFPFLRERQQRDGLPVFPVVCESCDWSAHDWLCATQAPNESNPLAQLTEPAQDRILRELATGIAKELSRVALAELPAAGEPLTDVRVYLDKFPLTRGPGLREERLIGREQELALLDLAFAQPHTAIASLVAWGGVGKTMLVQHWLRRLEQEGWFGTQRVYAWSFYSQGTKEDRQASEDLFLAHALEWFGVQCEPTLSPWDKGRLLADAVVRERTLLILDGIEPLQYPPGPMGGQLRAPGVQSLLKHLARKAGASYSAIRDPDAEFNSLVLVTTREPLTDLADFQRREGSPWGSVLRVDLGNLTNEAGAALLHHAGANRAGAAEINPDDKEILAASREVDGHALTLNLLGRFLARAHGGDIRRRDLVKFEEADRNEQGGTTFKMLAAFEEWFAGSGEFGARQLAVLRILGLFDRPADAGCIGVLRKPPVITGLTDPLFTTRSNASTGQATVQPLAEEDWNTATSFLTDFGLVAIQTDTDNAKCLLDCHSLIREHFANRLRDETSGSWPKAHRRLHKHLVNGSEYQPETLEKLQPLYQAITHCREAGEVEEALEIYMGRIVRDDAFYSTRQLGAFGQDLSAVECFFDLPWIRPLPNLDRSDQAWFLHTAGFHLRALGRLAEAETPLHIASLERAEQERWDEAANIENCRSELFLFIGEIGDSIQSGENAVAYADKSHVPAYRSMSRARLADSLHQAGKVMKARVWFKQAEKINATFSVDYPLLSSVQGFMYCDLLCADAERAAHRWTLDGQSVPDTKKILKLCIEVKTRVTQAQHVGALHMFGLISQALNELSIVRATLYETILSNVNSATLLPSVASGTSKALLTTAVDRLTRSAHQNYIPFGFVTRAWLRVLEGDSNAARADLDEAWDIASRGTMRLHMADIHLYRARLFFREKSYPWKSPQDDLAAAEKLINDCGYHRRDEELADAKRAILGA